MLITHKKILATFEQSPELRATLLSIKSLRALDRELDKIVLVKGLASALAVGAIFMTAFLMCMNHITRSGKTGPLDTLQYAPLHIIFSGIAVALYKHSQETAVKKVIEVCDTLKTLSPEQALAIIQEGPAKKAMQICELSFRLFPKNKVAFDELIREKIKTLPNETFVTLLLSGELNSIDSGQLSDEQRVIQGNLDDCPDDLCCVISKLPPKNPVWLEKQLYDRSELLRWVKKNPTNPSSRKTITPKEVKELKTAEDVIARLEQHLLRDTKTEAPYENPIKTPATFRRRKPSKS